MRRFKPLLLLTFALLSVVLLLQIRATPARASDRLNVIVIIADDQDDTALPIMRKLMANPGGKWFQFSNGFSGEGIGVPARASMLSGQHPHYHRVYGNKHGGLFNDRETLAVWMDRAGYYTVMLGKYMNHFPFGRGESYVPPGWDYFDQFMDAQDLPDPMMAEAVRVLDQVTDTQTAPFFFWFGLRVPQREAKPPVRYRNVDVFSVVENATLRPNFNEEDMSDKPRPYKSQPRLRVGGYDRTINGYPGYMWDINWIQDEQKRALQVLMAVDDGLQEIVDLLQRKGELDNTIIFYLSDTGYSWGAHRRTGRDCPLEECIQLPFLVYYPYAAPGGSHPRVIDRLVANVDVTATIVELTGIVPRRRPQVGESLLPLLTAPDPAAVAWDDVVLLENLRSPKYLGIRTRDWKYLEYADGQRELYDLRNDPFEMRNRGSDPAFAARRAELAALLKVVRAEN